MEWKAFIWFSTIISLNQSPLGGAILHLIMTHVVQSSATPSPLSSLWRDTRLSSINIIQFSLTSHPEQTSSSQHDHQHTQSGWSAATANALFDQGKTLKLYFHLALPDHRSCCGTDTVFWHKNQSFIMLQLLPVNHSRL